MFKADAPSQYVPSKSVSIKPDVVSDIGGDDQVRINIPSFVQFVDPNQTYLKFNLQMKDVRGLLVPDRNCGGHAVFRNIQYRDGNNQTNLEINEDYNANYSMLSNYTATQNINHKRELWEGVMRTEGNARADENLYYGARTIAGGSAGANPDTTPRTIKSPTLQLQLNSGLWNQGNVIPVSAMNGLKMTLDTENILRAFQYLNLFGDRSLANTQKIITTAEKAAGDDQRTADPGARQFFVETDLDVEASPFDIGDEVYICADDGNYTNEESLGFVNGFSDQAGKIRITYTPNRNTAAGLTSTHAVGALVFIKYSDRLVAHDPVFGIADAANVRTRVINAPSYVLNDIEMIVQSVSPPDAYTNNILKAAQTSGISFDILTYELYRHNQSNTNGLMQAQIPTLMKRAKAVFSQPLVVADFRNGEVSSLTGKPDNAVNYEWIHGTNHYPSRLVPLARYSVNIGAGQIRNEALHTSELQKAITNIGNKVHNLQKIGSHFCIARSLTKFGGVMDLSDNTLSLRVDYNAGANSKLFNNYVYGLRRVQIKGGNVSASNQVEADKPAPELA